MAKKKLPEPYILTKLGDRLYDLCVGKPTPIPQLAKKLACTEVTVRKIAREHPELFDNDGLLTGTY